MIDLRRLQVLRVLHEHGTITAAADVLHLTPSAISQQLRLLSRDIGADLLQREGRRVQLTPAAHTLLEHGDRLYAQWEQARADLESIGGEPAGDLRICGFPSSFERVLVPAAARLARAYPRLNVQMVESEQAEAFERLISGDADIAIHVITPDSPPHTDPRFEQRALLIDPIDLIVPTDHPLADREAVELSEASRETWVETCLDHHQTTLSACSAAGFAPRFRHVAKEWPAVIALIGHGFGVCLMPRLAPLPAGHRVVRLPLKGDPRPCRRTVAWVRRGSGSQPSIAIGLEALQDVARDLSASLPMALV